MVEVVESLLHTTSTITRELHTTSTTTHLHTTSTITHELHTTSTITHGGRLDLDQVEAELRFDSPPHYLSHH